MDFSHLEHLLFGLAIQALFILAFRLMHWRQGAWFGACFVIGVFLGREHSHREFEIGNPSDLIGYEALDIWRWSLDNFLDLVVPATAVIIVALLVSRRRH